jgi:hypothetical protein
MKTCTRNNQGPYSLGQIRPRPNIETLMPQIIMGQVQDFNLQIPINIKMATLLPTSLIQKQSKILNQEVEFPQIIKEPILCSLPHNPTKFRVVQSRIHKGIFL